MKYGAEAAACLYPSAWTVQPGLTALPLQLKTHLNSVQWDLGNRWLCNKDCTFAVFLFELRRISGS